jgi:nucleolar protein 56
VLAIPAEIAGYVPPDWRLAVDCGVCRDRAEYLSLLREVCIILARRKISEEYSSRDVALLQMVRTLDELDTVINLLTERAVEWYTVSNPAFSRKHRKTPVKAVLGAISRHSRGGLARVTADIHQLSDTRTALAREVSSLACTVLPNSSALIGGLVAARLMYHAGGLARLARLPGSTIQVLGARTALFSHLRGNTPPPKHGIIFQHRRVHNAPPGRRGRVARVLAAKLAIAARLDLYRGEPVPDFIETAQAKIDSAGILP